MVQKGFGRFKRVKKGKKGKKGDKTSNKKVGGKK